jgi:hypothetical protein
MLEHVIESCQCEGKKCSKCEEVKCTGAFHTRHERGYVYFRAYCKVCKQAQDRDRLQAHKDAINARRRALRQGRADEINARNKAYRAIHGYKYNQQRRMKRASDQEYAELLRAKQRVSRQRNHESYLAQQRTSYQRNIERRREYDRRRSKQHMQQYRRNHPEQMKFIDGAHHHKRRALKKNAPGNFTPAQIREQLQRQRYRCYYLRCGQSKFPKDKKSANGYRFTIEHLVPLNRTELNPRNDISNIVLACESCNASKRDKLPHEWSEGGRLF